MMMKNSANSIENQENQENQETQASKRKTGKALTKKSTKSSKETEIVDSDDLPKKRRGDHKTTHKIAKTDSSSERSFDNSESEKEMSEHDKSVDKSSDNEEHLSDVGSLNNTLNHLNLKSEPQVLSHCNGKPKKSLPPLDERQKGISFAYRLRLIDNSEWRSGVSSLLKQIHPFLSMTLSGYEFLKRFILSILDRLLEEIKASGQQLHKISLGSAINSVLFGDLGNHCYAEAIRAATIWNDYLNSEDISKKTGYDLHFKIFENYLVSGWKIKVVDPFALTMFSAVSEYLIAEVLEGAGNLANEEAAGGISGLYLRKAAFFDEEFRPFLETVPIFVNHRFVLIFFFVSCFLYARFHLQVMKRKSELWDRGKRTSITSYPMFKICQLKNGNL